MSFTPPLKSRCECVSWKCDPFYFPETSTQKGHKLGIYCDLKATRRMDDKILPFDICEECYERVVNNVY